MGDADTARPDESVSPEQRMFDFGVKRYEERLACIVRDLRHLADEVERDARVRTEPDVMGTPALIWSAQTVVHRVMWGLVNLNLDGLVNVAGDTELARQVLALSGSSVPPG